MTYQLQTLNERAIGDPRAFVLESEERYHQVLQDAPAPEKPPRR